LSTPEKVYVSVVFTPEGFCNMGYNDITLKAIEVLSQKYGYDYSFSVPETISDGMAYYDAWCNADIDENTRCLFIFASGVYEDLLSSASHPSPDSRKDVLIFEVEKELPYAYTFAMSYYGASYMIGSYYLSRYPIDFHVIAANLSLGGFNYVIDGFTDATIDSSSGSVNLSYLSEDPDGGLDEDDLAFLACYLAYMANSENNNIFIPYAGLSNLGVYRFSESNHQVVVGVDCIDPNLFSQTLLCMNKRMDLALDDFFKLWIKGEKPSRQTLYTLESGRVEVARAKVLDPYSKELDKQLEEAIAKEKEYFSRREVNE
jgi:hypothetical protein